MYGMTRTDGVERLAEVLEALRRERFSGPAGVQFNVTFSAGVAQYPEDGHELQKLYLAADGALDSARFAGGNRVLPVGVATGPCTGHSGRRCRPGGRRRGAIGRDHRGPRDSWVRRAVAERRRDGPGEAARSPARPDGQGGPPQPGCSRRRWLGRVQPHGTGRPAGDSAGDRTLVRLGRVGDLGRAEYGCVRRRLQAVRYPGADAAHPPGSGGSAARERPSSRLGTCQTGAEPASTRLEIGDGPGGRPETRRPRTFQRHGETCLRSIADGHHHNLSLSRYLAIVSTSASPVV